MHVLTLMVLIERRLQARPVLSHLFLHFQEVDHQLRLLR